MDMIARFRGEHKFLSNFAKSPIEYKGRLELEDGYSNMYGSISVKPKPSVRFVGEEIKSPTVEHAYQSFKTEDVRRKKKIRNAKTPFESAKLGRADETSVRDGWVEDDIKAKVMWKLVNKKFEQNPDLAQKLLSTDGVFLMEGNYWCDNYFGVCTCNSCHENVQRPRNMLGEILMEVRSRFRQNMKEI